MEPEENKAKGRFRMRSASVYAAESGSELPPLTEAVGDPFVGMRKRKFIKRLKRKTQETFISKEHVKK
jgi:hypothetical protein